MTRLPVFISLTVLAVTALAGCRTTTTAASPPDDAAMTTDRPPAPIVVVADDPQDTTIEDPIPVVPRAAKVVEVAPGLTVHRDPALVEIDATCCLDRGWLEQLACAQGTREHESLVVIDIKPSQIHYALLLAGFEPGHPGRWVYEDERYSFVEPEGPRLAIAVRYRDEGGHPREEPIAYWIRDHLGGHDFPDEPFVFGGSQFAQNPEWMGEGEHYVADLTGSIIGLVTFGDEVIGYSNVLSPEAEFQTPEWEVHADRIPAPGTGVTLVISAWPDDARTESPDG